MADKRMFTRKVTDDEHFLALSAPAQALYLHLCMSADDDGFCNQISLCLFKAHANQKNLDELLEARYVLQFPSGVVCIKHWKMANNIRKDRHSDTAFSEEMALLKEKPNGAYTLNDNQVSTSCQPSDNQVTTKCQTDVRQMADKCLTSDGQMSDSWQTNDGQVADKCQTNDRIDKNRLDKNRLDKERDIRETPTQKHKHGKYNNVLLTDEELQKLKEEFPSNWQEWIDRVSEYSASSGKTYKNNLATIRNWARRDAEKVKEQNKLETPKSYELEDVQSKMFAKFMSETEGANDDDGREDDRDFPF